jgi:hypothetical protein
MTPPAGKLTVGQTYCTSPVQCRNAKAVHVTITPTSPVASQSVVLNVRTGNVRPAAAYPSDGLVESSSGYVLFTTTGANGGTLTTATTPALSNGRDVVFTVLPNTGLPGMAFDWIAFRVPNITTADLVCTVKVTVIYDQHDIPLSVPLFAAVSV